jgi:hypothetical protein
MTDLYLVAHKVRGEPAFDIAQRMECPECNAEGCIECDDLGAWWIIPTSGHRAYPFGDWLLSEWHPMPTMPPMPDNWPDHYPHSSTPDPKQPTLADRLGITKRPAPVAPILRRI